MSKLDYQYPDCCVPQPHVPYKEMVERALLRQAQYWRNAGIPWTFSIKEELREPGNAELWTISVVVKPTSSYHQVIIARQENLPKEDAYKAILENLLSAGCAKAYTDIVTRMREETTMVRIPDHRAYPLTPADCK